jgi:deoxyribodipyrimidine photolyase-like uncharacterized protein
MEDFYRGQRRHFGVLMNGPELVGRRWNSDEENREPPPKKQGTLGAPKPYQPREDDIDEQVRSDLDRIKLNTVATIETGARSPRWNDSRNIDAVVKQEAERTHF